MGKGSLSGAAVYRAQNSCLVMLPGIFSCFRQRPDGPAAPDGDPTPELRAEAATGSTNAGQQQVARGAQPVLVSGASRASSGAGPPAAAPSSRRGEVVQQVTLPIEAEARECSPFELMDGLQLNSPLGKGTFGRVLKATWHGTTVAVKIIVTPALNHVALRETHLGPQLQHPHIVQTYATRCARLTNEYFDHIEAHMDSSCGASFDGPTSMAAAAAAGAGAGGRSAAAGGGGRHLRPVSVTEASGDGFGDPEAALRGDPTLAMYGVLYSMQAAVGHWVSVVILEYCDMKTLHTAIAKGLFLANSSWSQRVAHRALLRTAAEIARGLLHLHNAGVVHGDLKPANVLLRSGLSDRRGFTAKVADFGAAHVLPAEVRSTNTTTWGTVPYMAPEHLSAGRISRATDVHSFGIVLWEMLTQRGPYTDMQPGQVARGIADGSLTLPWPSEPQPPMDQLVALGRRCTDRDPAARPGFQEVMLELVRLEGLLRNTAGRAAAAAGATAGAGAGAGAGAAAGAVKPCS
ncbi:hypothetical protein PLESTM_002063300 [Pleodorina starrii]|nr:hypothetical protein PLESTM_002063300 [Pleodorina starrii]